MPRSGTSRPGGRTAATRRRVHEAVRDLLEESSGEPLQMARIAERSGVNAATLYRRWRSAAALVLEVVVDDLARRSPVMATGDLRADLLRYAVQLQQGLARPDGLHLLRAVAAVASTPDGEPVARELAQRRLDELAGLLEGAAELEAVDVVHGLIAPITYRRLLAPGSRLEQHELERLVDALLAGAAARRRIEGQEAPPAG